MTLEYDPYSDKEHAKSTVT